MIIEGLWKMMLRHMWREILDHVDCGLSGGFAGADLKGGLPLACAEFIMLLHSYFNCYR